MFFHQVHLEEIVMEDINFELQELAEQAIQENTDLAYEEWLDSLEDMMSCRLRENMGFDW